MQDKNVFFFVVLSQSGCNYSHPVINISRNEAVYHSEGAESKRKSKTGKISLVYRDEFRGPSMAAVISLLRKSAAAVEGEKKNTPERPEVQLHPKCSRG